MLGFFKRSSTRSRLKRSIGPPRNNGTRRMRSQSAKQIKNTAYVFRPSGGSVTEIIRGADCSDWNNQQSPQNSKQLQPAREFVV
jgi:hypothetical protein